jgi:hypothetical protein
MPRGGLREHGQLPAVGGEGAPTAKPPGSGLRTVCVDRVAVLVIVIRQLSGNGQDAGSQASRLERAPGGV